MAIRLAPLVENFCQFYQAINCYTTTVDPPFNNPDSVCDRTRDTEYYRFSIPGFDPCFDVDLSQPSFTMAYELECRSSEFVPEGLGVDHLHI